MYMRQRTVSRLGRSQPPSAQSTTVPAPVGGVNAYDSLMQMPPVDCIYTFNLMPVEYGLRLRKGYLEWAKGCEEASGRGTAEVRTIIPYESNVNAAEQDRLFAVTDEGIWDVTQYATFAPQQVAQFTELGDQAGRGVFIEYTGAAADAPAAGLRGHYLFYADGKNGLWQYEEATGLWTQPVAGVNPGEWSYLDPQDGTTLVPFPVSDIAYVMVWKLRIWVILENDDDAYYLPIRSISGQLTRFTFGSKMPHGGDLRGLWNWTLDGGNGVDDYMVAISRGGDVLVYQGSDPETDLQLRGAWFIGEVPESRRIVMEYGADLFALSTLGITSIKALLSGAPVAFSSPQSPSQKINRFLRPDIVTGKDKSQWQLAINPSDGFMQIVTPTPTATPFVQYNMNLNTGAWGMWEYVPMTCGYSTSGNYFMGASDTYKKGTVLLYDGAVDGAALPGDNIFVPNPAVEPQGEWEQTAPDTNEYEFVYPLPVNGRRVATIACPDLEVGKEYRVTYTVEGASQGSFFYAGTTDPFTMSAELFSSGSGTYSTVSVVDVPPQGIDPEIYIATLCDPDGQVIDGIIKDIAVSEIGGGTVGGPISFRALTAFQSLGEHARLKRVGIARTQGVLAGTASFNVEAVYDYKIETVIPSPGIQPESGNNVWNSAIWDESAWDFDVEGKSFPVGVLGMGRAVAVGIKGDAATRINIVGWDLIVSIGGYL